MAVISGQPIRRIRLFVWGYPSDCLSRCRNIYGRNINSGVTLMRANTESICHFLKRRWVQQNKEKILVVARRLALFLNVKRHSKNWRQINDCCWPQQR